MKNFCFLFAACVLLPVVAQAQSRAAIAQNLADDSDMYERRVYDDAQTVGRQVPLSLPVMPDSDIQDWLIDHVAQIMSVSPTLYPAHKTKVGNAFTAAGWDQMVRQWQQADIPELVVKQNYSMSALVLNPPRIVAKGRQQVENGAPAAYRWIVDVPVLLTYTGPAQAAPQSYNLSLRVGITRIPMRSDNQLIAIDQWGTTPVEPITTPDVPVVTP